MRAFILIVMTLVAALVACQDARADELDALMQQVEREASGKAPAGGIQGVIVSLTTGDTQDRRVAIWDAKTYVTDPAVRGKLEEFIRTAPPDIASPSAIVLGQQKIMASRPALEAALTHKSSYIAESAAYALGLMGDLAALEALRANLPAAPGLKRWIFEDAIDRLSGAATRPSPHPASLQNAGVYYFGGSVDALREEWKPLIDRYGLKVHATGAGDLNPDMHLYGGAPRTGEFFAMLTDKDGKPQLDVVFISDMLPHEFPYELQWRLFQFVRRGGHLVILGDSFFMSGEIGPRSPRAVHVYRHRADLWDTMLPRPLTAEFKPFAVGMRRESLTTAARTFGLGRVIHLTSPMPHGGGARNWADQVESHQFENILRYAFGGDQAFPALVELRQAPSALRAGEPLKVGLGAFAGNSADGQVELALRLGSDAEPPRAAVSVPVRMNGRRLQHFPATMPTDWTLPDGEYRLVATFHNDQGQASDEAIVKIDSPLRLAWKFPEFYAQAGGTLTGELTIDNRRGEAIDGAEAVLEVIDGHNRVLQQSRLPLTLKPGINGPLPLRLEARDYPLDSYHLVLRIVRESKTLNRSARLLHRAGNYNFSPDLVYVPWSGLDPRSSDRARQLMEDSGFNGARTLDPIPGWWGWSVTEPGILLYDTWPGDFIENAGMRGLGKIALWGELFRDRFPRWGTIDHWDEGQVNIHESERGDIAPATSAFYRYWLRAKYGTLDKLNAAWRDKYKTFGTSSKIPMSLKIPPAMPWEGDLSSWDQVWLYRGSSADWDEFSDQMWWRAMGQCHDLFMRTNRMRNPWHWHTVTHERIYATETPGNLSWQTHAQRARYGNLPSTIMIHCIQGEKGNNLYERFHWAALAGGARHMIVWDVSLGQTGTFGYNSGWTIWNADWTMKWWWKPAAESIKRVRAREQVLVDAPNALSDKVAILYHGANASQPPRALFDAIYFGGILPEAINPGATRSEQMDLANFRVIFRVGKGELPAVWAVKLDAWRSAGGTLVDADSLSLPDYGGKLVDAEKGIQIWTGGDTMRLMSHRFVEFQRRVMALLRDKSIEPIATVLDDQGDPAAHVEPALLTTRDGSQSYLLAACDAGVMGSQAFGKLDEAKSELRIMLDSGLTTGAAFKLDGPATTSPTTQPSRRVHVWLHAASDAPVDAKVTIDDKGPEKFRDHIDVPRVTVDRPATGARWIAGPTFRLAPGEHRLKVESSEKSTAIDRVLILDVPMIQPRLRVRLPGIKAVYDVYNQRELPRIGDDFLMTMRQARGEVYALVTEDLADLAVEPRWLETAGDRRLQLRIDVKRKDGQWSQCRHSFNVTAMDSNGKPIALATTKGSVRGWGVMEIFASMQDPSLPWTVRIDDLTSGKSATVTVNHRTSEAFAQRQPLPALECRVEPLPPLDGHINLVPFRATVINRGDKTLRGKARLDLPAALLIDGQLEKSVEVDAGGSATVVWETVFGREQALPRMHKGNPPQVSMEFEDGRRWKGSFNDVWMLTWDRRPPRLTDLTTGTVDVAVCNYLNRKITASLSFDAPNGWSVKNVGQALELPAAPSPATNRPPAIASMTPVVWKFQAAIEPTAAIVPGVLRLPIRVQLGDKTFAAGTRLVEIEKRRTWHIAGKLPMEGLEKTGQWNPPIPAKPVDALKDRLWGLQWSAHESDTLLNFPCEIAKPVFAVTNVRFAREGTISVRVRGREHASVWLGGRQMTCGAEARKPGDSADDLMAFSAEKSMKVGAGTWLPLVVRLERQTAVPLVDLVFLDEKGGQVWDVQVRAAAE